MSTTMLQAHYTATDLIHKIEAGLQTMGKNRLSLTLDDLAPVDEFHVRGAAATTDLIHWLAPTSAMHVLDLGSGLGGPARRLAQTCGCRVTGVDLSESYCATATTLNQWCGLDKQVRFQVGNVTDLSTFQPATFDAAWTIHVGMNIADKSAFYAEVARVLKPGGCFVVYEFFTTGGQNIHFPVPWAREAAASCLLNREEIAHYLTASGFRAMSVQDWTDAGLAFLQKSIAGFGQQTTPPPLGLHLVLGPIIRTMIQSLYQNLAEQRLQLVALRCYKVD